MAMPFIQILYDPQLHKISYNLKYTRHWPHNKIYILWNADFFSLASEHKNTPARKAGWSLQGYILQEKGGMSGVGVCISERTTFIVVQGSTCTHVLALKFRWLTSPQYAGGWAFLRGLCLGKNRYKLVSATTISTILLIRHKLYLLCFGSVVFLPQICCQLGMVTAIIPLQRCLCPAKSVSPTNTSIFVYVTVCGSWCPGCWIWYLMVVLDFEVWGLIYQSKYKTSSNFIHMNRNFAYTQLYTIDLDKSYTF